MKYLVAPWHGLTKGTKFEQKLNKVCKDLNMDSPGGSRHYWEFEGTLEDFRVAWGEHFLYYPHSELSSHQGTIYVTFASNFGQR